MKFSKIIWIVLASIVLQQFLFSQNSNNPVYVIVHGTWGGGWAFKEVDSLLTVNQCKVYRPTLTGQGERSHLSSSDIGLETHISDIVNTILYENLHHVILVGHSYGGMIVTGVADSIPDRIDKLVYLDAVYPKNDESVVEALKIDLNNFKEENGYLIPVWVPEGKEPPKDVPHSLKTWTEPIKLHNLDRETIPTIFILTVDKGAKPEEDWFYPQAERAKEKGWPILQLEADHNAQWSVPEELAKLLIEIRQN